MINKIIRFAVFNRGAVLVLTMLFVIAGFYAFQNLPIDAVPDITNNQVQINSSVEGLAPEEIERTVTFPVEAAMRGIPGVIQVRSVTRFGLSQVTVVFKDKVDIYRARQSVSERLQGVSDDLPKNVNAKLGPITTGLGEIYQYVVDYEKIAKDPTERFKQLIELRSLQDWFIKPRLLTVEGIAEVNSSGGFEKQFHIKPNPEKMARYGLHFDDILSSLEKANQNVGGGFIEQTAEQFLVQGIGIFKSTEDIKLVPLKTLESFKTITIGDIAIVELGRELRTGAATFNGQEAVLGTAMMLLGENSRTVSIRVHEKIQEIAKNLPQGIKLTTVYDRSELVNATLGTVEHNLITGALLVVLILLILIGNIRAALITALTIPITLLITFLVMKPLNISGNLMSLGALDFGIIVDGVVIVIDNCVRRLREKMTELGRKLSSIETKEIIFDATVEIRQAAGFGQLIIVIVFLPIFGLVGVEGKMFQPMAATFAIAVFIALLLSFATAPALASLLLSGGVGEKEPKIMQWTRMLYEPLLNLALKLKKGTLVVAILAIALGGFLFAKLGGEFLPQLSEGSYAFHMLRPVNIGIDRSVEFQKKAEEIVQSFSEVKWIFSKIGTSEVATDPMGVNAADTYIMLKDRKEWPKNNNGKIRTYSELATDIIAKLEKELPGMRYLASQPIQMRFNELLEGTRADVTVKIFGPDLKTLVDLGQKLQGVISKVQGAGDVEVDVAGTSPVLRVEPKTQLLNRFGIRKDEVLQVVSTAIGGEEVGSLYEGERRFPIIVRLDESLRSDLEALQKLPVGISSNDTVPISKLADLTFNETYGVINREDSNRRSAVMINLRGRDIEGFVNEAQALVEKEVKMPEGYYVQWGGNFKNLQEARSRLMVLTPLALIVVLIMIYAAFQSIGQTLLIFSCVPLALVGGVLGLMVYKLPFSISAGVGFIALSGIAVLNGVVLVNYFNQLRHEKGLTGAELVKNGTMIRLRPVLMTALVDVFGFLPMAISTGVGAEVQRPLAAVVIGGVISSTILTLVVLPALYCLFEKYVSSGKAH